MSDQPIQSYTEEVRTLIEERLRIRGATLEQSLRRAGRLLPPWARRAGHTLTQAQLHSTHPELHRRIDGAAVEKAHQSLVQHLQTLDPNARRKTLVLGILGSISFGLLTVAGALITYLWWRGFV
ncbi:hypothetical protein [Thalassorhabdomicrobium marinisediminis]|uniref:Uncharacterized protein n=1 Tax=Thalassorhabdomicrobium marinisediminis TaxID=2170577 RepID=A0A2T7FWY6_9RHOB|nr:hypothetical protein [Thalassorhabdomicrobium marinisediminis]PVA06683.1 hypothetical protein DC363_09135 [Thalassorhabdomicrobium marinisediminis]